MKKYLFGITVFSLAFGILSVSYLKCSSTLFASSETRTGTTLAKIVDKPSVEYSLPYAGGVLPDSSLWPLKALRDKVWSLLTFDKTKRSELDLLFADKRLVSSEELFDKKKPDLGETTLTKGEKYLEMASQDLSDADFAKKLALASLKHRQVIEQNIIPLAPDDLKPNIIKALDYSKNAYKTSRDFLNSKNIAPPKSPFND